MHFSPLPLLFFLWGNQMCTPFESSRQTWGAEREAPRISNSWNQTISINVTTPAQWRGRGGEGKGREDGERERERDRTHWMSWVIKIEWKLLQKHLLSCRKAYMENWVTDAFSSHYTHKKEALGKSWKKCNQPFVLCVTEIKRQLWLEVTKTCDNFSTGRGFKIPKETCQIVHHHKYT